MQFRAIHSLCLADSAASPWERLGCKATGNRLGIRTLRLGSPSYPVYLQFTADSARIDESGNENRQVGATGPGLFAIGLRVVDWDAVLARLQSRGILAVPVEEARPRSAWLSLVRQSGANVLLTEENENETSVYGQPAGGSGPQRLDFPIKRLDHLAIVTHDLDEKTRFWSDTLDVPVAGEVATPTMVIRQLQIGDAMLELLGPATLESPLWKRTPGLVSMMSWEVSDMGEAVAIARDAGFTVPDPAEGPLPGTRITTILGTEFGGVNLQLLEYVQ